MNSRIRISKITYIRQVVKNIWNVNRNIFRKETLKDDIYNRVAANVILTAATIMGYATPLRRNPHTNGRNLDGCLFLWLFMDDGAALTGTTLVSRNLGKKHRCVL